jgi:hypothetical protein
MKDHVKILGVLHIVMGALGALTALGFLVVFGGIASMIGLSAATGGDPDAAVAAPILGTIGVAISFFILLLSVPGIVTGWGLMKFKPWARLLGMIISALQLFAVPIGTAIGVYGLWVLLNNQTEALFRNPVQQQ